MKYGFVAPPLDANEIVNLAVEAEQAGWDGFFISESMWSVDAWICLTGAVMRTEYIRLGTLLSPLSIMRPWKLAIEAATLDQLSGGRVIVTVGMGAPDTGFAEWGEETDLHMRAERVDEGIDIIYRCWKGEPFSHQGKHYNIDLTHSHLVVPAPVQQPHIPIWVVGAWPRPKSMERTLRVDGIVPYIKPRGEEGRSPTPEDILAICNWLTENRTTGTHFDIIVEGQTPGNDPDRAREIIREWENVGVTWWMESWWGAAEDRIQRLRQGPPQTG